MRIHGGVFSASRYRRLGALVGPPSRRRCAGNGSVKILGHVSATFDLNRCKDGGNNKGNCAAATVVFPLHIPTRYYDWFLCASKIDERATAEKAAMATIRASKTKQNNQTKQK